MNIKFPQVLVIITIIGMGALKIIKHIKELIAYLYSWFPEKFVAPAISVTKKIIDFVIEYIITPKIQAFMSKLYLAFAFSILIGCLHIIFSKKYNATEKMWGWGAVGLIVGFWLRA